MTVMSSFAVRDNEHGKLPSIASTSIGPRLFPDDGLAEPQRDVGILLITLCLTQICGYCGSIDRLPRKTKQSRWPQDRSKHDVIQR